MVPGGPPRNDPARFTRDVVRKGVLETIKELRNYIHCAEDSKSSVMDHPVTVPEGEGEFFAHGGPLAR